MTFVTYLYTKKIFECLYNTITGNCSYDHLPGVAEDEGKEIFRVYGVQYKECEKFCEESRGCMSFAYCPYFGDACFPKEKQITQTEPQITRRDCHTYYEKICSQGILIKTKKQYCKNIKIIFQE